jgi:DNA-binding transcriptional MerR regulator
MNAEPTPLWTIHELVEQVEGALSGDYKGAASGRIRAVPDLRTARYYTTLGLLDRPVEMRGRTALYGPRHLLQLVAIKKLQALGLSLSQIQERLTGATDAMLRDLAGEVIAAGGDSPPSSPATSRTTQSFWKARPAAVKPQPEDLPPGERAPDSGADRSSKNHEPRVLQAIPLADHVTLLLPSSGPIEPEQLAAIHEAAAPLIHLLSKRHLIQSPSKGEGDEPAASPAL